MQATAARAAANAASDDDDEMPEDIHAFRKALARRISIAVSNEKQLWRSCRLRACKRARGCTAPQILCSNEKPSRPMRPEQEARNIARVQRALREHLGRLDAEAERARSADKSHKKS